MSFQQKTAVFSSVFSKNQWFFHEFSAKTSCFFMSFQQKPAIFLEFFLSFQSLSHIVYLFYISVYLSSCSHLFWRTVSNIICFWLETFDRQCQTRKRWWVQHLWRFCIPASEGFEVSPCMHYFCTAFR